MPGLPGVKGHRWMKIYSLKRFNTKLILFFRGFAGSDGAKGDRGEAGEKGSQGNIGPAGLFHLLNF